MAGSFFVILLMFIATTAFVNVYRSQLRHSPSLFYWLAAYHLFFFIVYYLYAQSSASDSVAYFSKVSSEIRGDTWLDAYDVGTIFIEFLTYPLVHFLGFDYLACMLFFSLLGLIGFFYFYLFFADLMEFRHKLWGIDFLALILFLPNMHFWTVSLGKGSTIFLGFGLLFYGLVKPFQRVIPLLLGALLVYHVRSHLMLVVLVSLVLASVFSSKGLSLFQKILIVGLAVAALAPVMGTFLDYAQLEETDAESLDDFVQHRGSELGKAGSGIDITGYNQLFKVFTFLFRPLFFDAPGALGIIVSFENLLYLFLFLKMLSRNFARFLWGSPWMVKVAFVTFFGASVMLAQVSGNLGIAIRQKTQVMLLFVFVLAAYADWAYSQYHKKIIGE